MGTHRRAPTMAVPPGTGNRQFFDDVQIAEEQRELDTKLRSTNTRDKLDALKRLIALMATGRDVSVFFPSVVVNIVSESFEVKVLVYMFLVRTADQKPEEALLSINSFQKDLAHPNPRVRALALRVMSSIRIQVIVPVVILAARKCAVDPSPYVRKSAAHAIPKIYKWITRERKSSSKSSKRCCATVRPLCCRPRWRRSPRCARTGSICCIDTTARFAACW